MAERPTSYVAKAAIGPLEDRTSVVLHEKTMYRGKAVEVGDEVFLFDAEHHGGTGFVAVGEVTRVEPGPGTRRRIEVRPTAMARQPIGRAELKAFREVDDGSPEAELDFKLYRQPTNKIVGIAEATAAFLRARC